MTGAPATTTRRQPPKHPRRLLAGLLIPVIAFVLLERVVGNATGALAITDGLPLLWVLGYGVWHHKVEPIGLIALVVFAIALGLTIALGGSPLPLELRRSWFPGAVGLACLVSLAVRRPLLVIASERLARAHPELSRGEAADLDTPGRHRALTILTAIIAVTGLADAAVQIALALILSASQFGVYAHVASYVIIGSGLAVGALYVRHVRGNRLSPRSGNPPPESSR